jgi:M6 family metalloprotease-like protein
MNFSIFWLRSTLFMILVLFGVTISSDRVHAGPALFLLQDYSQPTGQHFSATARGDEWKEWFSTDKDEVIIQQTDGFWYYAKIVNSQLAASNEKYAIDPPPAKVLTSQQVIAQMASKAPEPSFKSSSLNFTQSSLGAPAVTGHNLSSPHKLLVLLVEFTNKTLQSANTDAVWNDEFFGPSNSVSSYYKEVSNNQFYFTPVSENSGTADDGIVRVKMTFAHPNTSNHFTDANPKIVRDALLALKDKIDFAALDTDNNGYISSDELHIVTILAGLESSYGGKTTGVWGHRSSLGGAIQPPTVDGKIIGDGGHLGGYVQIGEMHDTHRATIGIIAHELGHDLGLPDLYDTDNSSFGLGIHSIMAGGSWGYASGDFQGTSPTHFDAWSKMYLGFTSAPEATATTLVDAAAGDVYRVSTPNSAEYYLIENRQFVGFDKALQANVTHGGIAIYHIDDGRIAATWGAGYNNVFTNDLHKGIKLVEANEGTEGFSQLDTKQGYSYDHYFAGSSLYTTFSENTVPSSVLYSGAASGVTITATSPSANAMTVTVNATGTASNANLSSIVLSQGSVSPMFSGAKTSYTATVSGAATSITVTPTVAASGSTVTVNGTAVTSGSASVDIPLTFGSNNVITLVVTSQDNTVNRAYTLTVNRTQGIEAKFIAINKRELNMVYGSPKVTLNAVLTPLTTSMKSLTWTSSNPAVATVNNGVVTAVGGGTANIQVQTVNGLTDTSIVTVSVPVTKMELDQVPSITLNVGDADVAITATITPTTATYKKVVWSTSNAKTVTVDTYGSIHAVAPGTAIITATTLSGAKTAKTNVIVPLKATAVTITSNSLTMKMPQADVVLKATIVPAAVSLKTLTWSSDDTSVVTVDPLKGTVKAIGVGDTFVKVTTTEGVYSTIPVKVIIPIANFTVDPTSATLTYGGSDLTLVPTIVPANATIKDIIWTSSDPTVASVNTLGVVHALNAGKTTITGTTADGKKIAKTAITVNGLALTAEEIWLKLGKTSTLKTTLINVGLNKTITWESSNIAVAAVSPSGLLTPKLTGETTVTASIYGMDFKDSMKVTVFSTSVTGINFTSTTATLRVGGADLTLTPNILPADASITKVNWSSNNTTVATVDSGGVVHAIKTGNAVISATTVDGSRTARVNLIVPIPVTGVQFISPDSINLKVSVSSPLKAAIEPLSAKDKKLSWTSSDLSVATVGPTGIITTIKEGSADITVTTNEGGFTDKVTVNVIKPVSSISFTSTKAALKVGGTDLTLTPNILPADATNKAVAWASNNAAVATVDANGVVHAEGPGTATITVSTVEGVKTARFSVIVPNSVKSIKLLHADEIFVNLKASMPIKASILPMASTNLKVNWQSSDSTVASVGKAGVITTLKLGSTIITATTEDGALTDTVKVTVVKSVKSIKLNKASAILTVGADLSLKTTAILPADADDKTIIWESTSTNVATVDSNGLVHAVAVGKTTITATSKDGSVAAKSTITVK